MTNNAGYVNVGPTQNRGLISICEKESPRSKDIQRVKRTFQCYSRFGDGNHADLPTILENIPHHAISTDAVFRTPGTDIFVISKISILDSGVKTHRSLKLEVKLASVSP